MDAEVLMRAWLAAPSDQLLYNIFVQVRDSDSRSTLLQHATVKAPRQPRSGFNVQPCMVHEVALQVNSPTS